MACSIGFTLQPEAEFLDAVTPLLAAVDYLEIAPETTWAEGESGALRPNAYHRRFLELGERLGKPFVAHGVGLSMGSAAGAEAARREIWLRRVAEDHERFRFRWYTDHLGATSLAGESLLLPLPLPMTSQVAATVKAQLRAMQRVVPRVGVENAAHTFMLGAPLEEPEFIGEVLAEPGHHLLLDLHNLLTTAANVGFDPHAWLSRLDLSKVIEIHVAGGSCSEPAWLKSGRVFRLDSHCSAVPEAVWALLAEVAPRCSGLQGITLERMEGTVTERDVGPLRAELSRLRSIAETLP